MKILLHTSSLSREQVISSVLLPVYSPVRPLPLQEEEALSSMKTLLLLQVSRRICRVHADPASLTTLGTAQTIRESSATVFLSFSVCPIVPRARLSMILVVLTRQTRSKLS